MTTTWPGNYEIFCRLPRGPYKQTNVIALNEASRVVQPNRGCGALPGGD